MGCVQGVGQDSATNDDLFQGYDGKEKEEYGIGGAWEGLYTLFAIILCTDYQLSSISRQKRIEILGLGNRDDDPLHKVKAFERLQDCRCMTTKGKPHCFGSNV